MDKVKELLVSPMIRIHFDSKLPTILEWDSAQRKAMGYALMQTHGEKYKLVEVEFRWLSTSEQNYGMTSFELAGFIGQRKSASYICWHFPRLK